MSEPPVPVSFDWCDYLKLAKYFIENSLDINLDEAMMRTAISRAYYASFCTAREHILISENINIRENAEAHKQVQLFFKKDSTNKEHMKIGINLERLRLNRNIADYNNKIMDVKRVAKMSIIFSDKIINLLKETKKDESREKKNKS